MNKGLHVEVISPEGYLFNGFCKMAIVPAIDGLMGIMYGHESVLSLLKEGKIVIQSEEDEREFAVNSGFVEIIGGDKLLILIDS